MLNFLYWPKPPNTLAVWVSDDVVVAVVLVESGIFWAYAVPQ
jgi:hypothetical protein